LDHLQTPVKNIGKLNTRYMIDFWISHCIVLFIFNSKIIL